MTSHIFRGVWQVGAAGAVQHSVLAKGDQEVRNLGNDRSHQNGAFCQLLFESHV